MPHQSVTTFQVLTEKTKGIAADPTIGTTPTILVNIQQLQPRSEMIPTEMDLSWGPNADLTADVSIEIFLSVIDIDNIPELAALQSDNAWAAAQAWRVSTGGFTIPQQLLEQADPRFFRPKSWSNFGVGAATKRRALCLMGRASGAVTSMLRGTIRFTEILTERKSGDDNAYNDVRPEGEPDSMYADDRGMETY